MKKITFFLLLVHILCQSPNSYSAIVINEFLADPPTGILGDANRDGIRNASDDEFVEILNTHLFPIPLSSWSLWDSVTLRHEFSLNTSLLPGERIVVFGGGSPTYLDFRFQLASSGSLSLNNSGDTLYLINQLGVIVDQVVYGTEASQNQSLVRSPEGVGQFQFHSYLSNTHDLFSPGQPTHSESLPVAPEASTKMMLYFAIFIFFHRKFKRGKPLVKRHKDMNGSL